MKSGLIDQVSVLLLKKGFTVKCLPRKWFDIVARRGSTVLIIKVLNDANSISSELAGEMRRIGGLLKASPFVVAEKAGAALEDGIVYRRFGVFTINFSTFADCIEGRLPLVMRSNSGPTVSMMGDRLARGMEERGYSLSEVARKAGVSRQMIARYKADKSEVSLDKAVVMRRLFGDSIFERVDIFSVEEQPAQEKPSVVARKYESLGFRAVDTKKAPFDIIAKGEREIILTEVGDKLDPEFESVTKLIDAEKLVIFDKKKPKSKDMPNISRPEFLDMETARELIKFLREFH